MASHKIVALSAGSAVRITPNGKHGGMDITLQNINQTGYIYVGGDDTLSSSNYGFRLMPNHSISFELPSADALYAISEDDLSLAVMITGLEDSN